MANVFIQVTRLDIHSGKRGSATSCPVGLAVSRALRFSGGLSGLKVYVGLTAVRITNAGDDTLDRVDFTVAVKNFISAFELGKNVQPITFYLTFNSAVIPPTPPSRDSRGRDYGFGYLPPNFANGIVPTTPNAAALVDYVKAPSPTPPAPLPADITREYTGKEIENLCGVFIPKYCPSVRLVHTPCPVGPVPQARLFVKEGHIANAASGWYRATDSYTRDLGTVNIVITDATVGAARKTAEKEADLRREAERTRLAEIDRLEAALTKLRRSALSWAW